MGANYRSSAVSEGHVDRALHSGHLFGITNTLELATDGDTHYMQIKTPADSCVHIYWDIQSDKAMETYFYEAPTEQTDGSVVTVLNMKRDSSVTSGIVLRSGVSAPASTGTLLETVKQGIDSRKIKTGLSNDGQGMILKKDTVYIRKFVTKADANQIIITPRFIIE